MDNSPNIVGRFPMILLGMVLCALPIFFLVVMPNFVPAHRVAQTQIFGTFGVFALLGIMLSFAWGLYYYFIVLSMIIPVLPYFVAYLAPFGGPMLSAAPETGLALLCLFLIVFWMKKNDLTVSPINKFIVLWLGLNIISLIFSKNKMTSIPLFSVSVLFSGLFLFMIHNIIMQHKNGFKLVLTVFILANCLFIIFGFIVTGMASGWSSIFEMSMSRLGSDVNTGQYGSNTYAGMMLLSLPIFFWVLVINPKFIRLPKLPLWIIFCFCLLMVLFSVSRGNIIALAFMVLLFTLYMMRTFYRGKSLLGLTVLLGVQVWVASSSYYIQEFVLRFVDERQFTIQNIIQLSMENIRVVLAQVSWDVFKDNWLFGVGQGNLIDEIAIRSGLSLDAHNLALNVLAEQGVLVFLLLAVSLIYLTYLTWLVVKDKGPSDRWLAICCYSGLMLFLLRSCITGGSLSGTQFVGGNRVCWMFTLGAVIYHLAKSPQELTGDETSFPPQKV